MTNALDEALHSAPVGEFVRAFNARVSREPKQGQRWVRVRPPDDADLDMVRKDRRLMPFVRVGASCFILEMDPVFVRCGSDSVILDLEYLLSSYICIIGEEEWRLQQSVIPTRGA